MLHFSARPIYPDLENKQKNRRLMSSSGKKKPPLVAERRNSRAARKGKKTTRGKTAGRSPVRRRKRAGRAKGGMAALALAPLRWLLRLAWRLTWRIGALTAIIVALAVGYYYTTLGRQRIAASEKRHHRHGGQALLPPSRHIPARDRERHTHQSSRGARAAFGQWRIDHIAADGKASVHGPPL